MALPRIKVKNAKTYSEAFDFLKKSNSVAIGGGTDYLHGLKDGIYEETPDYLVNLKSILRTDYIREDEDGISIGSGTSIHELEINPVIRQKYSALSEAAATIASPQIRNQATVAGNICQEPRCWYYRNAENGFTCMRKGGEYCNAHSGRNDIHSIFGAVHVKDTPCTAACPSAIDIAEYMAFLREGDWDSACEKLMEKNPLPGITGRVCPHFCMDHCNRNQDDESVAIRDVERVLGDYILANPQRFYRTDAPESEKRVAVIGAGPAGLSAAYYLRKKGIAVTVIDRFEEAGGMLRYAIPEYRLPKEIVKRYVDALRDMGVGFRMKRFVKKNDPCLSGFDKVIFTCGTTKERTAEIAGNFYIKSGMDFLHELSEGKDGPRIRSAAVLGGGNTAIDVALTLRRMGIDTTILYRRTQNEMPAIKDDVKKAEEEGVRFSYLVNPLKAERDDGRILLTCVKMALGEPDATGRPRPVPVPGSDFVQSYDAVYSAFGETADYSEIPDECLAQTGVFLETDRYFAGGDFVSGASTVTQAMAAGRKAAYRVCESMAEVPEEEIVSSGCRLKQFDPASTKPSKRTKPIEQPMASRDIYKEDSAGIAAGDVGKEAARCMNCGCLAASPSDLAPVLIVLEAVIRTTEREIPAETFFAGGVLSSTILHKGELIREIFIPERQGSKSVYLKYRHRQAIDFPLLSVAVRIISENGISEDVRVALGAAAPVPIRAYSVEQMVTGQILTEELAKDAGIEIASKALPLEHNKYKVRALRGLIRKALIACG